MISDSDVAAAAELYLSAEVVLRNGQFDEIVSDTNSSVDTSGYIGMSVLWPPSEKCVWLGYRRLLTVFIFTPLSGDISADVSDVQTNTKEEPPKVADPNVEYYSESSDDRESTGEAQRLGSPVGFIHLLCCLFLIKRRSFSL